jgi:hypothetical protein
MVSRFAARCSMGPIENSKRRSQTQISDEFGRIFRFIEYGEALKGQIDGSGYQSKGIAEQCKAGESFAKELVIELRSSGIQ